MDKEQLKEKIASEIIAEAVNSTFASFNELLIEKISEHKPAEKLKLGQLIETLKEKA